MFTVNATNYIDVYETRKNLDSWTAVLFGIACVMFGNSVGVDIW